MQQPREPLEWRRDFLAIREHDSQRVPGEGRGDSQGFKLVPKVVMPFPFDLLAMLLDKLRHFIQFVVAEVARTRKPRGCIQNLAYARPRVRRLATIDAEEEQGIAAQVRDNGGHGSYAPPARQHLLFPN